MFIGTEFKTLDRKGRLVVPSRYRKIAGPEEEGVGFYIIAGPGPYAVLYTKQEWNRLYEKVSRSAAPQGDLFDLRRKVFSSADFLPLDKQGRVILPPALISLVGLKQEIAVLGAGDHFEIWNKDTWEAYRLGKGQKIELNAQDQELWRSFLS